MLIKRRSFIKGSGLATASLLMPRFLHAFGTEEKVPPGNKVLVVLQLSGGNDGLNTIIPYRNDIYYKSRPVIGIAKEKAIRLTDEAGMHPSLDYLGHLFQEGELGVLNNVGYPEPDRSHFRSMDIWHSASGSKAYWQTGWLGRLLDEQCKNCEHSTQAVEIDDMLSLALKGNNRNGFAFKDPRRLYQASRSPLLDDLLNAHDREHAEHTASYLYKTLADTKKSTSYIFEQSRQVATGVYPSHEFGRNLKTVASLILSDINTKVYYVSIGSFDTHVGQDVQQTRLFKQINEGLKAFVEDLKKNNRFEDVLVMSFSEFGRRVAQNASKGTDHGTANNMFFISGGLKQQGILNELDDLTSLRAGDLQYKIDFRRVYATVLERWLNVKAERILGAAFEPLGFI
ncbi:DUF1501 domain-containing protein [Flavihumibacter sp. UBA7668]|uniref:DUF1501 domain-containing protein n=1 Tax=Flavihumibacter sp. UBA7668 TaxID=1946542 RepID=UPI0025C3528E|nr:DUF1501 domain-containing protein [Flavihumibacter sp. UBA7668]